MQLTDEQQSLIEAVRDLATRECGTREQRDRLTDGGRHPHSKELNDKVARLGWFGLAIPEEFGGQDGGMVDLCLFIEEIAYGQIPLGGFAVTSIVAATYNRFGNTAQKAEILGGIARGATESIAMSEPGAGSDVGALRCKATRENGSYVIDGHKTWISEAHLAEHILLVCRTETGGSKHDGMTMLNVPIDTDGIEISGIDTMGGRLVNDVFLTDCRVPAENVVGTEGLAWKQLMAGLNVERLIIAAQYLGFARRAFDDTLSYVKDREQFGRPIGSFQALKHRLADLATEIECAKLLTYETACRVDAAPDCSLPREASMAKLKSTEVARETALAGMQMMGGYGYASEYDMERHVRATLVGTILGGTSEIQREIIGGTYGL